MTNEKRSKLILRAGSVLALLVMCLMSSAAVADTGEIDCSVSGALTISDVSASNIGYHSATISWKTNGLADSLVEYGTTIDYGYIVYSPTLVSEHSITLTGLPSSTTYHYRVKSVTADGIQAISDDYTFTTLTPKIAVTAEPIQIPADGTSTSTITADVRDKDGNPVADGTIVRFTTNKGSFVGADSTTDKERVGGIATAELKSILSAETIIATVTAEANGSKGSTSVFFVAGDAEIVDSKTEITPPGKYTVDAKSEADTEVTKSGDGTPIVTVAKYESNPGGTIPGGFAATGEYIDVHLDSSEGVDQIEIKNYYTAAQVAGIDESSLRMRWWDGESWVQCSDSGVNTENVNGYSGYVWAIITAGTTPNLTDLSGAVLGCMGTPVPTEDEEEKEEDEEEREVITRYLDIDILGKVTKVKVSSSGRLLKPLSITDPSGKVTLELDRGTRILCPGGRVPQRLEIRTIQISPPQDTVVLDGVYRLDAYLYEYSRSPCLFTISPPGKLA
ncbi:MAG: hypothetical protein KAW00_05160, partial [Dehalococcoidia bacterium]|nr:hypothetical protein [Dehalococcoidia bacterium]